MTNVEQSNSPVNTEYDSSLAQAQDSKSKFEFDPDYDSFAEMGPDGDPDGYDDHFDLYKSDWIYPYGVYQLAPQSIWVAWRQEQKKDGKLTKLPKNPATGGNAQVPTNPETYGTRAAAEKRWEIIQRKDENAQGGIGIVLGEFGKHGERLVGIDLDSCRDPATGVIADWALQVIWRFKTYTEISPSETGVKLFFVMSAKEFAQLQELLGTNVKREPLTRKTFATGEHREVAIDTARFYAITGRCLKEFLSKDDFRLVHFADVEWFIKVAGPNYLTGQKSGNGHALSEPDGYETVGGELGSKPLDESGSGHGFRFMQDCHTQGMSYEEAAEAIKADENEAGEWANRTDERQLERAYENSKPQEPEPEPETEEPKQETESAELKKPSAKRQKMTIQVKGGELPALATRAEKELLQSGTEIYQRGNVLVRPIIEEVDAAHGRKTKVARFVEIEDVYLCDVLGRMITWTRYDARANKIVIIDTPTKVASTLLARDGEWKFPKVAGVISTPTLRPDGTIIDQEGYDAVTRLLLLAPPPMPPIPDKPTKSDALRALALLENLLVEFPFVGDVDLSVALSGLITPVVRGAFPVAPMHAANAPVAGSGKSYLFDCVAVIAIGRLMPVMAAGRTEEETEKRLGAAIMTGQALIDIDNVNGELRGDALCQMIERPIVDVRVLGESRHVRVEARGTTMFCTGINIIIADDLGRRVILSNLDPEVERPELREFKGKPVEKILADRGAYIAACLTICRAYIVAGSPNQAKRLASFEGWSDVVRSALIWLGKADPVASQEFTRANDPRIEQLRNVLLAWADTIGIGYQYCTTLQEVIKLVEDKAPTYPYEPEHPELHAAVQAVASWNKKPADEKSLGNWMRRNKNRIIDGLRLRVEPNPKGKSKWWIESSSGEQKAGEDVTPKKVAAANAAEGDPKKSGERQHGRRARP